ncbi:MAG: DUF1963 domain-containing protein, partial [Firmicutes bacterium]|nr:DUF1963 domain-containing protein [Bacillota bacterium]
IPEDRYLPIICEVPISFEKTKVFMTEDDYRFYDIFKDISKELGYELNDGEYIDDILTEDVYDKYYDEMNIGSWLIGYPIYTQFDPRENKSELQRYDTLLFQIDSDGNDEEIMFGDGGVANFFINGEALKKGDFSDILYNWDCG